MYVVAPPKSSLPENQFEFELPSKGKAVKVTIPKIEYVDRPITRIFLAQGKIREEKREKKEEYLLIDEVEEWIEVFSALLPSHTDAFAALTNDQIMDLSKAWLAASKVDIPESEASSDS